MNDDTPVRYLVLKHDQKAPTPPDWEIVLDTTSSAGPRDAARQAVNLKGEGHYAVVEYEDWAPYSASINLEAV